MSHGIAVSQEALEAILSEFRRRDERVEARYKMVLEQMMALAPLLLAHDVFSRNKSERDPLVERFLSVLTPEQIETFVRVLGPEQSQLLVEIAQRYAYEMPVDPSKASEQK